jgi:adenylate cyclase
MSEALPSRELSLLLSDWFQQTSHIIERHSGTLDKFIGDAVMAYWVIPPESNASNEANLALAAARDLIACARTFSQRLSADFPEYTFRIGVGLNTGDAMLGNVGTGVNQSFTVVGDSVNVAFRLEALTKEKKTPVIVSKGVMEAAGSEYQFHDLGEATVKGRKEPISTWALKLDIDY